MINTFSSTTANGAAYAAVRVSGIALPAVASMDAVMSDGSTRTITLVTDVPVAASGGATKAFGYSVSPTDLAAGLVPLSVAAYSAGNTMIATYETGLSSK
jgi:hypothetical protein